MEKYLFIGIGGFIGSVSRYGLSSLLYRVLGDRFPYGTMAVNVIGCFTIGLLMTLFEDRWLVQPNIRLFLTVGILGGFTTFSTFSYETIEILRAGNFATGSINIFGSIIFCLGATWAGVVAAKLV
jgi:fluoride exporter